MSKSETTNVDTKIKACLATLEAESKQLNCVGEAEIKIGDHLAKYPVTTIKAEDNKQKTKTVTVNETVAKKVEKSGEGR
jgi:hypothetical protein